MKPIYRLDMGFVLPSVNEVFAAHLKTQLRIKAGIKHAVASAMLDHLGDKPKSPIDYPIGLIYTGYYCNIEQKDPDNLYTKYATDALKTYNIIKDDNATVVRWVLATIDYTHNTTPPIEWTRLDIVPASPPHPPPQKITGSRKFKVRIY